MHVTFMDYGPLSKPVFHMKPTASPSLLSSSAAMSLNLLLFTDRLDLWMLNRTKPSFNLNSRLIFFLPLFKRQEPTWLLQQASSTQA